jgi:hypothetical protein
VNDKVYRYLEEEWEKCNSKKYQKYFKEWIGNITENQIYYYNKLWVRKNIS